MRKFLFIACFALFLIGCSKQNIECQNQPKTWHTYDEISELKIEWKMSFSLAKPQYFVYIYSESCYFCHEIKNEVIGFALEHFDMFYFVEYCEEIKILNDVSETIGKVESDEMGILGTPTLLLFKTKTLMVNIAGSNKILYYLENYDLS
ncbi:MAG: hypothetical protein MJ227_02680 [Bacilli bacterium]|nr:hypothetical protein [Bacilli bacterium]